MDKFFKNDIKFVVGSILVFTFGIFLGCQFNYGTVLSIQGRLFNGSREATSSNATNANATNSNATNSNATSSNATSSNATNSNASSANASVTDNIIYLRNFALDSTSVKQGDRVNVILATSGASNSAASIVFRSANGVTFTAQIQNITNNPYIIVPNSAVATTYSVTDVLLVGRNSNHTTFTKQYSISGANSYAFNSNLTVIAKASTEEANENKVVLNSLSLESASAKIGDKVYLNVNTSEKLDSLKLIFTSDDLKTFAVYTKDLTTSKPYIEIPSSVVAGKYSLTDAILFTSKDSTVYSKTGGNDTLKFDFNSTLEILDGDGKEFIYNNEDVNSLVLVKLYDAPAGSVIIINADSNTLINQELFNAIKGKNKKLVINYKENQIVFNGRDISNSKTVDINMTIDDVSSNKNVNKLVSNGVIVNFPNNGNLPGKALIRVKETEEIDDELNDNVYVYVYNESTKNFCVVDLNVQKTSDKYYEFSITHNSDYLLVNKKLDSKLVVESDDDVVNFQKRKGILLLLIGIGVVAIVATVIVILVLKKKKNKSPKDVNKKELEIENDSSLKDNE